MVKGRKKTTLRAYSNKGKDGKDYVNFKVYIDIPDNCQHGDQIIVSLSGGLTGNPKQYKSSKKNGRPFYYCDVIHTDGNSGNSMSGRSSSNNGWKSR
jgi:hypothetical protein